MNISHSSFKIPGTNEYGFIEMEIRNENKEKRKNNKQSLTNINNIQWTLCYVI